MIAHRTGPVQDAPAVDPKLTALLAAIDDRAMEALVKIVWQAAWDARGEAIAERLGLNIMWPDGEAQSVRDAADLSPALALVPPAPVSD